MIKRSLFLLGALTLFLVSATPSVWAGAEGSPLIWQSPVTISGDSDVSTTGSLVAAFNMFGTTVAVNGVTFTAFSVTAGSTTATNGNFSFSESPAMLVTPNNLGSASAPFSNLSANYRTLLSTAISTSDNNTLTLTMTGLTLGLTYQFQWWVNASNFPNSGFDTTATSGPQVVTLDSNTTNANGGVGQMVIGTFSAGANFQTIAFTGTNSTQAPTVNAFQLRVIPEPGSLALLAVGGASIAALLRQRRRTL
jgi:hypothetical protein